MSPPDDTPLPSPSTIRILLLEENDADVALVTTRLRQDGLDPVIERVVDLEAFATACRESAIEIILADFRLPAWDGWRALEIAHEACPDVPFIFVSGVMGEDLAVDSLRHGATDYVLKDRLGRLAPAIQRALEERAMRRDWQQARSALRAQQINLQLIADNIRDIICLHGIDRTFHFVSAAVHPILGYEPAEWIGRDPEAFGHPDDLPRLAHEVQQVVLNGRRSFPLVLRVRHRRGHYVWLETTIEPITDAAGHVVQLLSVSRDFTERRIAEEAMRRGEQLFEGIAEANRLLLTAGRVVDTLPDVLRVLGLAAETDRVAVFEFHPHSRSGEPASSLRAEWARDSIYSLFSDARLAEYPLSDLGNDSIVNRINAGEPVEVTLDDLHHPERELIAAHGVVALLTFPIRVDQRVWGHIVFDHCSEPRRWTPAERSALGTVASNIGQAIGREQALGALAASERRYEDLLAGLSEGVFQIDLEARWRFLNPTWQALTGYTVEASIGQRFAEFVARDDAAAALEGFGRLISGRNETIESELRFLHRRGDHVWLRVTAQAQIDHANRVVGVSGTLVDVTQRRLAQEALRTSERKFAAVFASSSDALLLLDTASGTIVECNPRAVEMFERASERELIDAAATTLLRRPLKDEELADMRTRMERGETWIGEVQFVTARSRVFWGQIAMVRLGMEVLGATLMRVTDISHLKESEERLRASLMEKEVLLKEVYHRVKNNLQIISALLRMQARRVSDSVALEALENSISRVMAMSMVHEKLYQAQNLVSIDFFSFAENLVGFLNQLTVGSRAPVVIDVTGVPLALSIDQAIPLGLVLNELVTNSLKYAFPEGRAGRIDIAIAADPGDTARVMVSDDGVGLPEDTDIEGRGGGLGFRIVRMLVEQLQGTLTLENRGGLRATVRVPMAPLPAPVAPMP
ncbi:MAG: PAS domain S-box protein [Opitutaceae bacterium]|nr:PAS domain S-box protein [Opitutaceae bacterium]